MTRRHSRVCRQHRFRSRLMRLRYGSSVAAQMDAANLGITPPGGSLCFASDKTTLTANGSSRGAPGEKPSECG
jgi:hypothetical protein